MINMQLRCPMKCGFMRRAAALLIIRQKNNNLSCNCGIITEKINYQDAIIINEGGS